MTDDTFSANPLWDRFARWAPLLFVAVAFLCWGGRTLWDTSEARYGQAAYEMIHAHNWLMPALGGQPHLTKPPLSYWLMALGMELFGINAWGARFFLSASFLATIFAVQQLARSMGFEPRKALAAALIYATAAIPFAGGHTLTTDGFLVLWETMGVLAAWQVWRGTPERRSRWRLIFWAAFGLAFLTKGPPGWLPLLAIASFLWLRSDKNRARLFSGTGLFLFLIISFSWYGLMVWQHHDLLGYFLKDEVYKRVFTTEHHRNAPFWIYPPILLAGVGPWMVLWPWLGRQWWQYRPSTGKRLDDWQLFCLLWLLISLLIFTISKSRLIFYVLPLFVPLSLALSQVLIDELLPRLSNHVGWRRGALSVTVVWTTVMVIYTGGMELFTTTRSLRPAARVFREAIAEEATPSQLYWLWAGKQRYSLAFYMHQVVRDTETVRPLQETTPQPLYVTEEQVFAAAGRDGRLAANGRPRVLATAQGYVLFAMEPAQQPTPPTETPSGARSTP